MNEHAGGKGGVRHVGLGLRVSGLRDLSNGLVLASIFDQCHPYQTIFLIIVELLLRRQLVQECGLALGKK